MPPASGLSSSHLAAHSQATGGNGGGANGRGMTRANDSVMSLKGMDNENEEAANIYRVRKSRLIRLINWTQVGMIYLPFLLVCSVGVLCAQVAHEALANMDSIMDTLKTTLSTEAVRAVVLDLSWKSTALLVGLVYYLAKRERPVYLVDFATFQAPKEWKLTHGQIVTILEKQGCFTPDSIKFMARILEKSATGQSTAWPPGITRCLTQDGPADRSVEAARNEAAIVIFKCVEDVLKQTGVKPKNIDFLIINCSLFSPTPSLCSMVVHKFGLRSNCRTYNLSGMGCSAGVISVDLAKELLKASPQSVALIVSTENLTQNLYHGNERAMLLQNTLFRCGGAAIIVSNRWQDATRAKFKLLHTVRTQGQGDEAYECVFECEDADGHHGVRLSKDIVTVAGRAMEKNFTSLGPLVLPLSEQLKVVYSLILKKTAKYLASFESMSDRVPAVRTYIPDFKRGIDHFCIHAGGRGVIDGIEKNLKLQDHHSEASRYVLKEYGNTSSSSIWYELEYIFHNQDLRRGQRVLQVAFGSGFKCNSAVWLCLNAGSNKIRKGKAKKAD